jgi:Tn3 transposase DDE domain
MTFAVYPIWHSALLGAYAGFLFHCYSRPMNKASCLSLLSNAALVWNTMRMGEIVARLRAAGEAVSDEDLARISPLAYAHVIPNGTYVFDRSHSRGGIAAAALS